VLSFLRQWRNRTLNSIGKLQCKQRYNPKSNDVPWAGDMAWFACNLSGRTQQDCTQQHQGPTSPLGHPSPRAQVELKPNGEPGRCLRAIFFLLHLGLREPGVRNALAADAGRVRNRAAGHPRPAAGAERVSSPLHGVIKQRGSKRYTPSLPPPAAPAAGACVALVLRWIAARDGSRRLTT
jgi:hypothetical protein